MKSLIYIEGGDGSKLGRRRCRQAFSKLLEGCGLKNRMPDLRACGRRDSAFDDFKTAFTASAQGDYIAMLVDSEDPVRDPERTWEHLRKRDPSWVKPDGASDEHVFFITTCMETWIVADRAALQRHYGKKLRKSALPPLDNLEDRHRHDVQDKLSHATRNCSNAYAKGKRSFVVLETLDASALEQQLPSFARMARILRNRLKLQK